jgi:hypothetical protein
VTIVVLQPGHALVAANFLDFFGLIPHIGAIVTGAWTFNGSAGATTLVTDFSSYCGERRSQPGNTCWLFQLCPGSSQHPRDIPFYRSIASVDPLFPCGTAICALRSPARVAAPYGAERRLF